MGSSWCVFLSAHDHYKKLQTQPIRFVQAESNAPSATFSKKVLIGPGQEENRISAFYLELTNWPIDV